jgi:methionine biosynthesis protein MetW
MSLYNDNRNYDYTSLESEEREEYKYVVDFIKPNSKVIDLGCGNGSLMKKLIDEKNAEAYGIDLSESAIEICTKKGLKVDKGEIDKPPKVEDDFFDYSICNVTMQMVMYPEILLKEMKRISKYQVISFPNFAFYKNRFDLFFNGRMPKPMLPDHTWYNTGHIHQFSIKDFYELISFVGGLKIIERKDTSSANSVKQFFIKRFPNFFSNLPVFLLTKS